jgi:carboxyl-terminal processing protease
LDGEPNLNYLKKVRNRYDLNKNKKLLSLNYEERKIQKELRKSWLLKIENERRIAVGLDAFKSFEEMEDFNENDRENNYSNTINLDTDFQLIESTKIIKDFLDFETNIVLSSVK